MCALRAPKLSLMRSHNTANLQPAEIVENEIACLFIISAASFKPAEKVKVRVRAFSRHYRLELCHVHQVANLGTEMRLHVRMGPELWIVAANRPLVVVPEKAISGDGLVEEERCGSACLRPTSLPGGSHESRASGQAEGRYWGNVRALLLAFLAATGSHLSLHPLAGPGSQNMPE